MVGVVEVKHTDVSVATVTDMREMACLVARNESFRVKYGHAYYMCALILCCLKRDTFNIGCYCVAFQFLGCCFLLSSLQLCCCENCALLYLIEVAHLGGIFDGSLRR